MTTYRDLLVQLISILEFAGERTWKEWLTTDLKTWDDSRSVQHHLTAYGGMGSFTDFSLSSEAGHSVSKEVEPWINAVFEKLRSLAYVFAKRITRCDEEPTEEIVKHRFSQEVGCETPPLLAGWCCKACQYAETADRKIVLCAATYYVSRRICTDILNETLAELVQHCQHPERPEIQSGVHAIKNIVEQQGISIVNRTGWMRPCPKCGSQKTEVCQWRIDLNQKSIRLLHETLAQKLLRPRWIAK